MISSKAFSLNFKIINLSYYLGFIPFFWDEKKKILRDGDKKLTWWVWKTHIALVWFYLLFLVLRFIQTIITGKDLGPVVVILFCDWLSTFLIVMVSDLTSILKRKELLQLVNSLLIFNERLQVQLKDNGRKKSLDILYYFFQFSMISIVGNCVGPAFLYALAPYNPRYFSSVIFDKETNPITFPFLALFFMIEVYYFLHAVCTIYVNVFQIALVQFAFIEALKTMASIPLQKECCWKARKQASIYRQIQYLNVQFHDVFRFLFLPAILLACISVGVLSYGGIIKLHSIIGLGSIIGFITMAFACTTVLTATTFITGRSANLSLTLFYHWRKSDKSCNHLWMKKFLYSNRPIRCYVGGYKINSFTMLECSQFSVGQIASFVLIF